MLKGEKAKAMADQIMTISKERLKSINDADIISILQAIKVQLSINY